VKELAFYTKETKNTSTLAANSANLCQTDAAAATQQTRWPTNLTPTFSLAQSKAEFSVKKLLKYCDTVHEYIFLNTHLMSFLKSIY